MCLYTTTVLNFNRGGILRCCAGYTNMYRHNITALDTLHYAAANQEGGGRLNHWKRLGFFVSLFTTKETKKNALNLF